MIRVRQGLETDTDAGLAKEAERAGNGDALQPMQGPQEAVANATVDGGLVILGNGSQIRSTRANTATPKGPRRGQGHDELLSPARLRVSFVMWFS
jgi:hypothetical protein